MTSIYKPDNTQAAVRYGVIPLQKVSIDLRDIDRSNGEYFASLEGDEIYVENADYPALLTLTSPAAANVKIANVLRAGLRVKGPFKGLTITHPLLASGGLTQKWQLVLTLGKGGNLVDNNLSEPTWALPPSIGVTTNTALLVNISVQIPPGARFLRDLCITIPATAVTSATWLILSNVSAETVKAPLVGVYNTANFANSYFASAVQTAGAICLRDGLIPLAANAQSIEIAISGTGLAYAGFASVRTVFE